MLNDNIKIDLHIHSCHSKYKDGDVVKDSTIDHLDRLVRKLNDNEISLCAITDHNGFDYQLYCALRDKIASEPEGSPIKKNLPGIEFDVTLEENKPKCHIITIFDDSDEKRLKTIEQSLQSVRRLSRPNDAYTLEEFEQVLKKINLNTILIVHQRQSLDNSTGNTNSLSNATSEPSKFIKVGFIDCLEYNRPRVEGIVKSNLRSIGVNFPVITGSDCHDWKYYPYHDKNTPKATMNFTKFKCLPTFKGLLMAVTSFSTRVNQEANSNSRYIQSVSINNVNYPLANGINVIIGDNGSGKSMLAGVLANKPKSCYKELVDTNHIGVRRGDPSPQITYIEQGSIAEQVKNGNLFEGNNSTHFDGINTKEQFASSIRSYFSDLCKYINKNIQKQTLLDDLSTKTVQINPIDDGFDFYYPVIKSDIDLEDAGDDNARLNQLDSIVDHLESELKDNTSYYEGKQLNDKIQKAINALKQVRNIVRSDLCKKNLRNRVRGIIKNKLDNLEMDLKQKRTSEENSKNRAIEGRDNFKNSIIDCMRLQFEKNTYPQFPTAPDGVSIKEYKGYSFCKIAKYHNSLNIIEDEFYKSCFNKNYRSKEAIQKIKTKEDFSSALSGYDVSHLDDFKSAKLENFIREFSKEETTISEISSNSKIGNTPGEISLVYYRFTIQEVDDDYNVLVIDQPEDDISPKRINSYLNTYLNSIRDKKQVIIVTHNPLLVVNLDVDNVIHLTKVGKTIKVRNGALEYENEEYSILNLVKENLDGGYGAIERRLKAYGQDKDYSVD